MPKEVIIVDDCSTDGTYEEVKKLFNSKLKIRYFALNTNSGAQAARNRGIDEARCKWVAFLDSDDEWLPNKLDLQVRMLRENHYDESLVIHGNCIKYNRVTNEESTWILPKIQGNNVTQKLLRGPAPVFPALLTSKKLLLASGGLDNNVPAYQEWDTSILLSMRSGVFIHIDKPLFIYYTNGTDTISQDKSNDILGYRYIVEKYKKYMSSNQYIKHLIFLYTKALSLGLNNVAAEQLDGLPTDTIANRLRKYLLYIRLHPKVIKAILNKT